mmetsp:Transcript_39829/g.43135  ORF Transcript_39829/g.43135 Transcript_39829/m.43135 type:complete len:256 (-) Transcript_39829:2245-3012(-)
MVRRNLIFSTIASVVVICCCSGFTPESSSTNNCFSHDRLDIGNKNDKNNIMLLSNEVEEPLMKIRVVEEGETRIRSVDNLPPVLQEITNERKNFHMNLGKAMDTLRKDMPYILKETPDYSIYHQEITVVDPSGVQLTGIDPYKSSIKFMQQFIKFWFQEKRSGLQYRLVYDFARSSIKVSWHAVLVPKMPLGKPLHVDGISMYKLDPDSGKITEHKFETMSINNTPIVPPYSVFSLLQQEWGLVGSSGGGIPAGL